MRPRTLLKLVFLFVGIVLCAFVSSDEPSPPIMLDTIHFFVDDAGKATEFFTKHFDGQLLAKPEKNPLPSVEYIELRPGQASIAISPRDTYPGMHHPNMARWRRSPAESQPAKKPMQPVYGVHWLALRTENLKLAVQSLEKQGLKIAGRDVRLPGDPAVKAVSFWGPGYTLITVVQRSGERRQYTPYGIDHLLILVRDLPENIKFFQEVYAGKIKRQAPDFCQMLVGSHLLILATPSAIGLPATTIHLPDSAHTEPRIRQLSFLYHDPQPAYQSAAIKGYGFSTRPSRLIYHNKPTPYIAALLRAPDGIYCEMYAEEGRNTARTVYVKQLNNPDVVGNKREK